MKIVASSPTRIDLAGGTLDLWPVHHLLDHKATVNVAITCNAEVEVTESGDQKFYFESQDLGESFSGNYQESCSNKKLPLFGLLLSAFWKDANRGLKIKSTAKSPAGAGLGGSSCLAVTMGAALWKMRESNNPNFVIDEYKLVQTAQDVEARLIQAPTGCQDYWGAVRGGVNLITFPYGGVEVKTFDAEQVAKKIDPMLIACYSGKSRASAINNWEIYKRIFDGDQKLLEQFNKIGLLAEQCGEQLIKGNVEEAINLSKKEWQLRCKLWPNIETKETKALDEVSKKAGAYFSRVCGAGGGGVMAVLVPQEKREAVCKALKDAGGTILDSQVSTKGLTIN